MEPDPDGRDALAVTCRVPAGWRNALAPSGKAGPPLVLADRRQARAILLIPSRPTPQERKAADDLGHWLRVMTGAAFPVVWEPVDQRDAARGFPGMADGVASRGRRGPAVISLGRTAVWEALKPPFAADDLGDEGYAIAQQHGMLFLTGGPRRGPLYAVYALLEEDLGCRWYDARSALIPARPRLALRAVSRRYVPALTLRDPYCRDAFDADWSLHNRTNAAEARVPESWGGHEQAPPGWFVHTAARLVPPDIYFRPHPEYFAEVRGQRQPCQWCPSHPDMAALAIERVREALRHYPHARQISVSPNDTPVRCACAACRAAEREDGSPAGPLLRLANAVADAVRAEFPRVAVTTLAYQDTLAPPRRTRPRANVLIYLCTDRHAWSRPFLPARATPLLLDALRGWRALGARVIIWDYTVNFSHLCLPMPNLPAVAENIRDFCDAGVAGILLQGAYQSPGGENAVLRSWMWSKLLWTPARDPKALLRDFTVGYFGRAAAPLLAYQQELWRIGESAVRRPAASPFRDPAVYEIRYTPDVPFLSASFLKRTADRVARAARLAARDADLRRRVALAKLPLLYTRLAQAIGVMNRTRRFWMGAHSRLRPGARRRPATDAALIPWIDEAEAIVRREGIAYFREIILNMADFPEAQAANPTDSEAVIAAWRDLAGPLPPCQIRPLANRWAFQTDPADRGVREAWFAEACDDRAWTPIVTDLDPGPGHVGWEQVRGFETYIGTAWYRQWFRLPREFAAHPVWRLVFLLVKREAEVWINGRKAAAQTCATTGYAPQEIGVNEMPFQCDPRPWLKPTGPNLLAVRVRAWRDARDARCGICKPVALAAADRDLPLTLLAVLIQAARAAPVRRATARRRSARSI